MTAVNAPVPLAGASALTVAPLRQPRWATVAQVGWLMLAAAVALLFVSGLTTFSARAAWLAFTDATVAMVYAGVGGLIVWRRPTDRLAVYAAFTLLLFGAVTFPDVGPFIVQANPTLALPYALLDLLGRVGFGAFVFVFPDGRFAPASTRWVALVWIAVQAPVPFLPADWDSPLRDVLEWATNPVFVLGLVTSAFSQVYKYRRLSTPIQRQQTRWTAFGLASGLGLFLAFGGVQRLVPGANAPIPGLVLGTLAHLAMVLVPLSIGVALLWHGLFDVDALIGRTLVYAAVTVCIVAIYMLVVGYLGSLFRTDDNLLISLLATGAVAALFQPLRERIQRAVNRLLYGQRDEPYTVMSDLGRRLDASADQAAMLPAVVDTVARALKLPYAAIRVDQGGRLVEAASTGSPVGQSVHLALVHQNEPIGELVLGRRGGADPFGAADARLLDHLARQAAAAVYAVRLTADLQRSRQSLVNAREEERRRLRRDLHDGLGPTLAALGLKLETARNRLADDPRADALLGDLAERTHAAVADIRRLVYALRPPTLDELGLVGALRQLASGGEALAPDALRVEVEAPDPFPQLPAAVEVAAYRIAAEAFTNVVRHAHARTCTLSLFVDDDGLWLSIADDGIGLPAARPVGVGLSSMRERAEELGGVFLIGPVADAGTRVQVSLPLPMAAHP